jgi:ferrochelatase
MAVYDALLLVSFGGPEGPDDVLPFMENVTRGRGIPTERLVEVSQHYQLFGGVSPINGHNRELIEALRIELAANGIELPIYWGNRNWHPMLADTVAEMAGDGVTRAVALVTSAWSSYSACRQYLDDIERARGVVGADAPVIDKIRPYFNHPGFIEAQADRVRPLLRSGTHLVFTAHSVPKSMADTSDYEAQLREASALVASALGHEQFDLAFQSRSGPPSQPWLEPDINDHLVALAERAITDVVIVPIGFVSDHMEVVYDLDTQAAATATSLGMDVRRAPTVGTHPLFVRGLRELIEAQIAGGEPRSLGQMGPRLWPCAPGCCPAPAGGGRPERR